MFILNLFRGSKNAVTFDPGQVFFSEGDPGDSMFVVLEGEVEIRVHDKVIDTSQPGELLGEMALVAGYGKLPNGKSMASRTNYIAPHGAAFANGIEVSYGAAAFKRPDTLTPNYVLYVGARSQYGMPVVS